MKIKGFMKYFPVLVGVTSVIAIVDVVTDLLVDRVVDNLDYKVNASDEVISGDTVEVADQNSVEDTSDEVSADSVANIGKRICKAAIKASIAIIASDIIYERGHKDGVAKGGLFFTNLGVSNEMAGALIKNPYTFDWVLYGIRKAR